VFGTYRFLLAIFVVFFHIGYLPRLGSYAVFGFYVLSGYLMTLVMHTNYGYTMSGATKYVLNRILRIYPIYWLACLLSVLLIATLGAEFTVKFHEDLAIPSNIGSVLRNMFLVFPHLESPRLTPPSWALTVELFYYGCIGLGLSRSKFIALAWLGVAVFYHVYVTAAGWGPSNIYFPIFAAALPFSIGALIFLYRDRLLGAWPHLNQGWAPHILFMMVLANGVLGSGILFPERINFYLNVALNALLILSLSPRQSLTGVSRLADRLLGDFSYPIYLVHYQVALIVFASLSAFGLPFARGDNVLVILTLPLLIFTAWLLSVMVERPIDKLRRKIRA
jgi:peptidoglycan/LPS O-acetylase OafA/YrhL